MVLPGFSVRDTNLSAGGQGREHDHCPAALPPQGEPGGTEAGEAAHISADWKNNAMEWVCVCCAVFKINKNKISDDTCHCQKFASVILKRSVSLRLK